MYIIYRVRESYTYSYRYSTCHLTLVVAVFVADEDASEELQDYFGEEEYVHKPIMHSEVGENERTSCAAQAEIL